MALPALAIPLLKGAATALGTWAATKLLGGDKRDPQTRKTLQVTKAPPTFASPLYNMGSLALQNLYGGGQGANVYQGPRVAPLSGYTQSAIRGLGDVAGQYRNPYFSSLIATPTYAQSNLSQLASGGMMGGNSYFQRALQNRLGETSDYINSLMSGAGRYGSGAHAGALGRSLGDVTANALASQYNQDISQMMAANQAIDAARMNQLQGAQNFYGGETNALMNALRGASLKDAYEQNILNAMRQRFQEQDESGWNRLNRLLGATRALSGDYGSDMRYDTTIQDPGNNPMANLANIASGIHELAKESDAYQNWRKNLFSNWESPSFLNTLLGVTKPGSAMTKRGR